MWFFCSCVFFLHSLSSNDLYFGLLLSIYWYYEIRVLLPLANICVKANVLLCLARLWTCFVGFSYSRSGPNIQPQSGVITPCEQKSVTRVPERCLRLRRLPEWLVRVQRLQSFRCDKLSKLSDVQIHLYFRQFLCFPHHFICFKWKCHIKLMPAFWLV